MEERGERHGVGGEGVAGAAPVRWLPVGSIRPGPYQPRQGGAEEDLEELVASVRAHGVIQPVVVRPVAGGFELVAGERRWRAAMAAGLEEVPAWVRELSDREAAVLALVENLQRADLHYLEQARACRRLLEEFRLTQEELARQIGVSQSALANKLRLLQLEEEVQEALVAKGLSERHARLLLALRGREARLEAVEAFARRGMTVREAEAWLEGRGSRGGVGRGRKVLVIGDVRVLFNTIRRAVRDMRAAGFHVELEEEEGPEAWEVRVRVRKGLPRRRRLVKGPG